MTVVKKNIVVIGGGYAGISVAQDLAKLMSSLEANITLIEKQSRMHHAVGSLRGICDPNFQPKIFVPYEKALPQPHANLLEGIASRIEKNQVTVQVLRDGLPTGEEKIVQFDYLIVATGSSYPSPIKFNGEGFTNQAEIDESFNRTREALRAAGTCLVIGGGAVGVEMAAEIRDAYPEKKVILLDGNKELLAHQTVTSKFRRKLLKALQKMEVDVRLGDALIDRLHEHGLSRKSLKTTSGADIDSDVQFCCAGARPNTAIMETLDPSVLTKTRAVRVKANFQVGNAAYSHIYVIGDASNHPTPKLAFWGKKQANFLAKNLSAHIKSNGKIEMKDYDYGGTEAILVPLGKTGGVGQLPLLGGTTVGNFVTRKIKSEDLFTAKYWSQLNATAPK